MTIKLRAILSSILLLLALILHQSEATVSTGVKVTNNNLDATAIETHIDYTHIRGNGGVPKGVRHLEGKERNTHKRASKPFFSVLLASLIVNVVTLVSLLSLIPVLMNSRWSCFKSMFWVANALLRVPLEITKNYNNLGRSSMNNKVDQHATGQTATLLSDLFIPSLACGSIMATALFLVIPESIFFIQRGTSSVEGEIEILPGTISRFGVALMMGYMIPLVLGALFPRSSEHVCSDECVPLSDLTEMVVHKRLPPLKMSEKDENRDEENMGASLATTSRDTFDGSTTTNEGETNESNANGDNGNDSVSNLGTVGSSFDENPTPTKNNMKVVNEEKEEVAEINNINFSMATSILIGDAAYNFFDGIYIGVAFLTCSNAIAVCVTLITIYNEISQEMADYFLLTKYAGISIPRALLLNFAAGLAVVVGALLIVSAELGDLAIGVLLAFAAGVYLHISASECLPRVYSVVKVSRDRYFSVLFFIIGALPIGLTLLKHGHCNA